MATKGGRRQLAGADYHHGNLRRTLMRAGIKTLKSDGVAGLSMRKLAREAGVSHNAPYMHFRNKQSVVAGWPKRDFGSCVLLFCGRDPSTKTIGEINSLPDLLPT